MNNISDKIHIGILKLNEKAVIPTYSKSDDACMDITATSFEFDTARNCYVYHTGLAFDLPKGYELQIRPRSSIRNYDVYLTNSPGTVDSGYHGEVLVCFKNHFSISDRIRLNKTNSIIKKIVSLEFNLTDEIKELVSNLDHVSDEEIMQYAMENAPFDEGDRIAQFKISTCPKVSFNEVTSFNESERGTNGFGSTGK